MTTIASLKDQLTNTFPSPAREQIANAIQYVSKITYGQKRKNGEPTITHPLNVAHKVHEMGLGHKSICAALLHDLLEDYPQDKSITPYIRKTFGEEVLHMVKSLTKFSTPKIPRTPVAEIEAVQKYLIATVDDIRIMIIKLADKLHNLKTIEGLTADHRKRYLECIEKIYIPISEYLGLWKLRDEMKDIHLLKKDPKTYAGINEYLEQTSQQHILSVAKIKSELTKILDLAKIPGEVTGRVKTVSSIYAKLKRLKNDNETASLESIKDTIGLRVLTNSRFNCYRILKHVREFYEEEWRLFDDYIKNPKPNGYKSIHCLFSHPEIGNFELQIRTYEMQQYSEFGPASHLSYKKSCKRIADRAEDTSWAEKLVYSLCTYDPIEDDPIKTKIFDDQIFVITPKKDIIQLPAGAVPLDLAYELHTELGNSYCGATINGTQAKIETRLKTGDIVFVQRHKQQKYAKSCWLKIVKTEKAMSSIRRSIKRKEYGL